MSAWNSICKTSSRDLRRVPIRKLDVVGGHLPVYCRKELLALLLRTLRFFVLVIPTGERTLLFVVTWRLTADSSTQRRHLHGRQRRLKSLISHLQSSAVDRLLEVFAREHSERMRHPSLLRRLPNAPRHFIHDHVIVGRIAAQQTTNADDRVVLLRLRQLPRRQRNLKRPRHANQIDILLICTRSQQPIDGAQQQPLRNERVES